MTNTDFRKYIHIMALFVLFVALTLPSTISAREQTVGLFQNDSDAFNGYTLFTLNSPIGPTYLIDMDGRLVHSWDAGRSGGLLENGNLLLGKKQNSTTRVSGGLKEVAWDGAVVWEYTIDGQHHDFERLPNGNILLIVDGLKTKEQAIAAGRNPALLKDEELWPLTLVELTDPTSGEIVWEWRVWDHLIQDFDSTKANYGVVGDHPERVDINFGRRGADGDWLHIIDEMKGQAQNGFHLNIQNLSTGASVRTVSGRDAATGNYIATLVDAVSVRAAKVGDVLEISVQTSSPLTDVQPLRHTVTTDDVKRSRIHLADLVAYQIPTQTQLLPNYPNPFNPETWMPYRLAEAASVTLTIYDATGHLVRSIDVGHKPAAVYESRSKAIYWDGRNDFGEQVASGLYFYTLTANDFSATRKMLILK